MKTITLDESIAEICIRYPEIKDILFELGFKDIVKPGMLQTVGRFMNLKKGVISRRMDLDLLIKSLEESGFTVETT